MKKYLKEIMKDQSGLVTALELLIVVTGVVIVSGLVLIALTSPLKAFHEGTTSNITKLSRGF